MQVESYGELSRLIHAEVNSKQIPVNGTIELTNRCPLTCAHCYNNLAMDDGEARALELTTAEHIRVLDELAGMGCLWLLFTGGEIFARRDFFEIYRHAKSRGFLITLFTNGTLITERVADALAELPPFAIEITLYGRTRETYETLTGIPGSFDRCLRGIELLRERSLPLKLKTVAVSMNRHEVAGMREFATSLGVEFAFDAMISPRIDCSSSPLAVRLKPREVVELDLVDPVRVSEYRRLAKELASPVPESPEPELYDCGGGVNSFAIDPYGNLTICVLSHVDRYNLRRGSVREGWESFLRGVRSRKISRPTKCTACALKTFCGMCPATGELENGDAESPVDFLCHVAHLRAEVMDVDVRPHGDCEYCPGGSHRDAVERDAGVLRSGKLPDDDAAYTELTPLSPACGTGCSGCAKR